ERVSMFIVDNDGFGNSDKRYPTDRVDDKGVWLHNDLAPCIDKKGNARRSKLYSAMIEQAAQKGGVNEFGEPLGEKFGIFTLNDLRSMERGVDLLPDNPLRDEKIEISLAEWEDGVEAVTKFSQ